MVTAQDQLFNSMQENILLRKKIDEVQRKQNELLVKLFQQNDRSDDVNLKLLSLFNGNPNMASTLKNQENEASLNFSSASFDAQSQLAHQKPEYSPQRPLFAPQPKKFSSASSGFTPVMPYGSMPMFNLNQDLNNVCQLLNTLSQNNISLSPFNAVQRVYQ